MPSFDVVSKLDRSELKNALDQTQKELSQRYDFRGTGTRIEAAEAAYTIFSDSDERARSAYGVFVEKLSRRKVSIKHFDASPAEPGPKGTRKMVIALSEGIDRDKAKTIIAYLKNTTLKVQASVQEDTIRVTAKKRDELQTTIAELKAQEFEIELQFINFRD